MLKLKDVTAASTVVALLLLSSTSGASFSNKNSGLEPYNTRRMYSKLSFNQEFGHDDMNSATLYRAFQNRDATMVQKMLLTGPKKLENFPGDRLQELYEMMRNDPSRFGLINHAASWSLKKPIVRNDDLEFLQNIFAKDPPSISQLVFTYLHGRDLQNNCIDYLIDKILSSSPEDCYTAFTMALKYTDERLVKILIRKGGFDVNASDDKGITPIMILALEERDPPSQYDACEIAQILIDHGADLDIKGTSHDRLPFQIAENHGNHILAEYLKKRTPGYRNWYEAMI